jgi:hypothetical protein
VYMTLTSSTPHLSVLSTHSINDFHFLIDENDIPFAKVSLRRTVGGAFLEEEHDHHHQRILLFLLLWRDRTRMTVHNRTVQSRYFLLTGY